MNKIVQEKKTSSRVRFKLQDVIALRKVGLKLIFPDFFGSQSKLQLIDDEVNT